MMAWSAVPERPRWARPPRLSLAPPHLNVRAVVHVQRHRVFDFVRNRGEMWDVNSKDERLAELRDSDVRPLLRAHVRALHGARPRTVILEELGLRRGVVRVDLAAVNGSLHGFEIKSARDSLRRLPGQVTAYGEVMDLATLVTTEHHAAAALGQLPSWWGVLVVVVDDGKLRLDELRPTSPNPLVNARALAELIWYNSAIALLQKHQAARGVIGKPRAVVWDRLAEVVDLGEMRTLVRRNLKRRAGAQVAAQRS